VRLLIEPGEHEWACECGKHNPNDKDTCSICYAPKPLKKIKCNSCGHVFKEEMQRMVRCPCGKSYIDWMYDNIYRYGGDVFG